MPMILTKSIDLHASFRTQAIVGLGLSAWLYFFLTIIAPFDAADLRWDIRLFLMVGYGVLFFLCYLILIPIQNWWYQWAEKWTVGYEVATVLFFCVYCLPVCFVYYKTEAVNGTFSFRDFALTVYLPICTIIIPFIFVARYGVAWYGKAGQGGQQSGAKVTLLGENKLDLLQLEMKDLVAVEAANNYVAVHYLLEGKLQKKLLRSSLRNMHQAVPALVQVHRSYLVNWQHVVAWKDGLTLVLTQFTVPVSQKYKSSLLERPTFAPN